VTKDVSAKVDEIFAWRQLSVPPLGYGAMRGPAKASGGRQKIAKARAVLRRAVELISNIMHYKRISYGPHVSEELTCRSVRSVPGGLVIATKGGWNARPESGDPRCTPAALREAVSGSLKRCDWTA